MSQLKKYVDPLLLGSIVVLLIIGVFMVASSSWGEGLKEFGDGTYYFKRHIVYLIVGMMACVVGYIIPLKTLRNLAIPLWVVSMILCLALYTRLGVTVNGATRWLAIPKTHFQFMPSDLLKYASIFFVAHLCTVHRKGGRRGGFLPILAVIGASAGIVIIEDFSSASVIGISLMSMFFISGMSFSELMTILFLGMVGIYGFVLRVPYRLKRLTSFINPFDDIANTDWQLANSLYSIGIGSITGVGYFNSYQTFNRLPEAYNDFIFAVIGQEFGLIGSTFVIIFFALFIARGFQTVRRQDKLYEKLVATGIVVSIGFQAFFNMGVAVGLLPVTGLTLPFISYGGTALVLVMGMSGILLRLSAKGASR